MLWLADTFTNVHSEQGGRFEDRGRHYYTYLQRAHRERAEAFARAFSWADRGIHSSAQAAWTGLVVLGGKYGRVRRKRVTNRELSALSDDALEDIGLQRGDIPAVAAALANGTTLAQWRAQIDTARLGTQMQYTGDTVQEDAETDWRQAA